MLVSRWKPVQVVYCSRYYEPTVVHKSSANLGASPIVEPVIAFGRSPA